MGAQNNVIRTKHIKAKFDNTQQNSKFGLAWFVGFCSISTFVGYLMPNLFYLKQFILA